MDMSVLVEVHNQDELERALMLNAWLIEINNRDLNTFETHLETTEELALLVPPGRIIVSESGNLQPPHHAAGAGRRQRIPRWRKLMRQPDIEGATRALLSPAIERDRQVANA